MRLTDHWDDAALQAMIDLHWGKTLPCTDQGQWSDEQVVACRSQVKTLSHKLCASLAPAHAEAAARAGSPTAGTSG